MKRWIDAGHLKAARTSGGHRRVPRREAVRFVRERRLAVADPDILGLKGLDLTSGGALTAEALTAALTAQDAAHAEGLIVSAYVRGDALSELFDGPVRASMDHIGTLWGDSEAGIMFEHRAVDLLLRAIHRIRSLQPDPEPGAPVAVGGAVADDPYLLPSLMVATVLSEVGFRVTNLGPNTPTPALAEAARRIDADLLWLSVSTEQDPDELKATLGELTASVGNTPLAVGGRGLDESTRPEVDGVEVLLTMDALVDFARRVRASGLA